LKPIFRANGHEKRGFEWSTFSLKLKSLYSKVGGYTPEYVFTPLDGQQRLTTLFLLHWYLIPKDKLYLIIKEYKNSIYSRFSYETRISSKDFCNAIVAHSFNELKDELNSQIKNIESEIENKEKEIIEIENLILKNHHEFDNKIKEKLQNIIKQLQIEKKNACLSNTIKNQSWFLWTWRKDPTIKSIFVMLDEIDKRIGNQNEEIRLLLWNQLEQGKIVFNLLPLEQFALTDELYVKMNARGKELSNFDIFKSTLEEQMRLNNVSEEVQNKWRENVDSNWIDLFWNKLAKPHINENTKSEEQIQFVNSVENGYLRFLKRMMVFHLFAKDNPFECDWNNDTVKHYVPFKYEISKIPTEAEINNILDNIREYSFNKVKYRNGDILDLLPLFCKSKFFNQDFFIFIINSFESLIYYFDSSKFDATQLIEGIYFEDNPNTIFEAFIAESINYDTRVQFYAILQFLKYIPAEDLYKQEELKSEFNSWMRVIRNLSTNTNNNFYNKYDDFLKSLKELDKWGNDVYGINRNKSIIEYLVNNDDLKGFDNKQISEEKEKANLITNNNNWSEVIVKAEEHQYFLGQIRFLLEWSLNDGVYDISLFENYQKCVEYIFDKDGLNNELSDKDTHYFRNCLMANCQYYLLKDSFIYNKNKDRDRSWKNYLRDSDKSKNIKKLIDKWQNTNLSFIEFCKQETVIGKQMITDWRRCFLNKAEIYNLCNQNQIVFDSGKMEVRLLETSTTWNGLNRHSELETYYWALKFNGKYNNSQIENPLCAIFKNYENHVVTVNYASINNLMKYRLTLNYDPKIEGEFIMIENNKWEKTYDITQYIEVEADLSIILK
jgi:hypothetical protein